MKVIEQIHQGYTYSRRAHVLAAEFAKLIPQNAHVLDVGCGDGFVAKLIMESRPDIRIEGIDVLMRPVQHMPVKPFDGSHIPHADGSFDEVMFIDVLHHTEDPMVLLREAARVSRNGLLIKDHMREGILAGPTLEFMDWVGNARHNVALPHNYWTKQQWLAAFRELHLDICQWDQKVPLYPWWAKWLFGRSLHYVGRFSKASNPVSVR
jgi:ubiquinone/menaquinone biosynthesis C-methylase UbiE